MPIWSPSASEGMTRVKARTPGVKAISAWAEQMELGPSEPQAFWVATRSGGATAGGSRVVAETLVQTASDCEMTWSIAVRRAAMVWFCVRIETGLVPRVVLQRTAMLEAAVS